MKKLEIDQMSAVAGGIDWGKLTCAALLPTLPYWLWASLCSSRFQPNVG